MADRTEFVTMLTTKQADLVRDTETAARSYTEAVQQVARAQARSKDLRQRRKAIVARLRERLDAANGLVEKLSGFSPTTMIGSRLVACPVSRPYSYVDTWGAARSSGRAPRCLAGPGGTRRPVPWRVEVSWGKGSGRVPAQ
jgi:hypothetical protein